MYEDYNFIMKDNRWYHLEFESDSITKDDLKRFREYEAIISRTYGVAAKFLNQKDLDELKG